MKRQLIIATAAAAALVAGGTVTAVAVSNDASGSARSGAPVSAQSAGHDAGAPGTAQVKDGGSSIRMQDDDAHQDLREARVAKVSAPDAAAAALKAVPGTVSGLDLDTDRSGLVWEADVLGKDGKWHEITLDAGTARVLNQHVDQDDDDADERTALQNARTDAAAAARTAASHGTVTSVELDDNDGGKPVWEVETITKDGKEHTFLVDPQSANPSAVAAQDTDDDADDNDGADD
ncbi:PepSY domain-containing protein [Streptomyces tubercidicus]|uniref:PepSY domain-containing protein n=1 Tax=Streptomyces tubercidicus TaxID=47759 RepID=UPI003466DAAD